MLKFVSTVWFLTLIIPLEVLAQKEASIFFLGNGNGLDFSKGHPELIADAPRDFPNSYTTIADADGKLLFYCDQSTVWNSAHAVMENGVDLKGISGGNSLILQKPGTDSIYYIFQVGDYPDADPNTIDQKLIYAEVDIKANNGSGRILSKQNVVYSDLHGSFTVSGNCETGYWLVGEANRNILEKSDKIFAFRIDHSGVSKTPVVSTPVSIGNSGNFKFSPNGAKIFFSYSGNGPDAQAVVDFDQATGMVSNLQNVGTCCGIGEFSDDGNFLYTFNWENSQAMLNQVDLTQQGYPTVILKTLPSIGGIQLAPDKKIYFLVMDGKKMGVINFPWKKGLDCDVKVGELFPFSNNVSTFRLPQFATNLLFHSSTRPDAGPDIEVCSGQEVKIGSNESCQNCEWLPHSYLNNPYSNNPIFKYNNPTDTIQTLVYKKTRLCESDIVKIKVFPQPHPLIYGSYSVCPRVEGVEYWTNLEENNQYLWSVEGGTIISGQSTNRILINWGATNPDARVKLLITNQFGCISEEKVFKVHINVELETPLPNGPTYICDNKVASNVYQINPTNGSVYTWESEGGIITKGQGTYQVTIDWNGVGNHWIRVREESITIDTVCYGISEKLAVAVYRDSLKLKMNYVTLNPINENEISIVGEIKNQGENFSSKLDLLKRVSGVSEWITFSPIPTKEGIALYEDYSTNTDFNSYEYQFRIINGCGQPVVSNVHNTLLLETTPDTTKLFWNAYVGWEKGVKQYNIFRKVDNESDFVLINTVPGSSKDFPIQNRLDGFNHTFIVQAISNDGDYYSWSNSVSVEFEHKLFIPNVFTPNNDGINDSFFINPIQLYPENELIIYNRWGGIVYQTKNYTGAWTANNVSSGVYYYQLYIDRQKRDYRGWVQIVR